MDVADGVKVRNGFYKIKKRDLFSNGEQIRICSFLGRGIIFSQVLQPLFGDFYAVVTVWVEGLRFEVNQPRALYWD